MYIILHVFEFCKAFFQPLQGIFFAEHEEGFGDAAGRYFLAGNGDADGPHDGALLLAALFDKGVEGGVDGVRLPRLDGFEHRERFGQKRERLFGVRLVALVRIAVEIIVGHFEEEADLIGDFAVAAEARAQNLGDIVPFPTSSSGRSPAKGRASLAKAAGSMALKYSPFIQSSFL